MADGGGDIATLGVVVALNCEVTSVLINSEMACMSMAAPTGLNRKGPLNAHVQACAHSRRALLWRTACRYPSNASRTSSTMTSALGRAALTSSVCFTSASTTV